MALTDRKPELKEKLGGILTRKNINDRFILPFDRGRLPYNIRELYPGYESYGIDIGSGWGEFSREMAARNSSLFMLALEKKKKRVYRSLKYQKERQLTNINSMVLDVEWFFSEVFAPAQFDHIYINFPDPWPKEKHHKHRFMTEEFCRELDHIAAPGATLEFATDYWPYMSEALQILEAHPHFENVNGPGRVLPGIKGRPETFFQRLQRSEKLNTYFAVFSKK